MKRSVAIYGPTPQFVRWTIKQACPFRELSDNNLPDQTFRQLRSIRELSLGIQDGRFVEGFCLHPTIDQSSDGPVLGFPAEEVWQIYGPREIIEKSCGDCPANTPPTESADENPLWAGCYGWLSSAPTFRFGSESHHESMASTPHQESLVDWVHDIAMAQIDRKSFDAAFPAANQAWYSLWQNEIPNRTQLTLMSEIFEAVLGVAKKETANDAADHFINGIFQFKEAIKRCLNHNTELHLQLITAGHSDGLKWTTSSYCPGCRAPMEFGEQETVCKICNRRGNPTGGKKSKVLGLRPYIQLDGIVGAEKTKELVRQYKETQSAD
jgi:hypothetical protein